MVITQFFSRNNAGEKKVALRLQSAEREKSVTKNVLHREAIIQNKRRDKQFPRQKNKNKTNQKLMTTKAALKLMLRETL